MGLWNELWRTRETRSDSTVTPGTGRTPTIPPARDSSPVVNPAEALTLNTVYRAIAIQAIAAKQCSIDVYRGDNQLSGQQVPSFIRQPNTDMSQRVFVELTVTSLATTGNSYWYVERDASGRVLNISVLDPRGMQVVKDTKGDITEYQTGTKTFPADAVKHLKLFRRAGEDKGLGPIQAAQADLRSALDTRTFAGDVFGRSGVPTRGYLKSEQVMSPDQREEAREAWTNAVADPDGIPVMGQGFNYQSILLSPKDAQWLEAQRFSTTAIARMFGTPANLLLADVEGTSQTYQNVAQSWTEFAKFGLMQYLSEIEDALSSLIPGLGVARFNLEALLRADTQTRYATYATAAWMTKNEIRAIEGLPPIAGGDTLSAPTAQPPAPGEDGEPNG